MESENIKLRIIDDLNLIDKTCSAGVSETMSAIPSIMQLRKSRKKQILRAMNEYHLKISGVNDGETLEFYYPFQIKSAITISYSPK
ncbi:hypothetical protein OnM2_002047 [Erysiphe neolycopersici]|uniref:Uncharacterized protein n=1 Tax=Erysiphe neolycopersici TaxID=212602 RepID=A0A420I827_9PEZI|nr:hypothetical protein OnM2_002047 [Erysiphe neolycopersici]